MIFPSALESTDKQLAYWKSHSGFSCLSSACDTLSRDLRGSGLRRRPTGLTKLMGFVNWGGIHRVGSGQSCSFAYTSTYLSTSYLPSDNYVSRRAVVTGDMQIKICFLVKKLHYLVRGKHTSALNTRDPVTQIYAAYSGKERKEKWVLRKGYRRTADTEARQW